MTSHHFTVPLFVPANRPERFDKAAASGADAIILDLEDAVAADQKSLARAALDCCFTELPVYVRINGGDTPWFAEDLAQAARMNFAGIILPKAELGQALDAATSCGLPVLALIETARGMAGARQIAETAGVERLLFGSIDYCADLGCQHVREALLSARCELVLASRLAGLVSPVDGVTTALDDAALISSDALHALQLGFGGKLAIHPKQIAAILQGFRPQPEELAWAHKVLASGDGAVAVDGAMVDEPVRLRARAILRRAGQ